MELLPSDLMLNELAPLLSLNDLYQLQFINSHYFSILQNNTQAKFIRQKMHQLKLSSHKYESTFKNDKLRSDRSELVRSTIKHLQIPPILHRIDPVETSRCMNVVAYHNSNGICFSNIRNNDEYCRDCSRISAFNPKIIDPAIPYDDYNLLIDDPNDPDYFCYDIESGTEISFVQYRGEMYDMRETSLITEHNRVGKLWTWLDYSYIVSQ